MTRHENGQEALSPTNKTNALDYYADLSHLCLLSREEERELGRRVREGDRGARSRFIEGNLRLVVHLARAYTDCGLPRADLIAEGNIGLMHAVDKFDPDRGTHFATYAAWWIKQAILRALDNQARTLRLPSFALTRFRRLSASSASLEEQLGRTPTSAELAHACGLASAEVERLLTIGQSVLSLDALRGQGEEDCDLHQLLSREEEQAEPTLTKLCAEETREECSPHLRAMLTCLSAREWQVVLLHFGFDGTGESRNYRQIAQVMGGISKERVRQLLQSALTKLRQSQQAQTLSVIWHEQEAC